MTATAVPLAGHALVLDRLGELPAICEVLVDPPGAGEARVRMLAAGVCHTDVGAVRDARATPVVLGHEGVGVVESVGAGVDTALLGRRVLLAWKTPCGSCRRCLQQRSHLCESPRVPSGPRVRRNGAPLATLLDTGCFCTYAVVPADACIAVPDGLGDADAAVVGCAVATGVGAALHTAKIQAGDRVAVWGVGGVGQNVVVGAQLALAGQIIAVDPDPARRQAALRHGAGVACGPDDALATIARATGGAGVDVAFDVVGRPETMATAIDALGVGGTLVLVGAAARTDELCFQPRRFMSRQQRIVGCIYGSLRPRIDLPLLLRLCADRTIPTEDMLGGDVTLDELPQVFAQPSNGLRTIVRFT